jgi:DNA-binding transcriptional MerR regulator
MSGASSVRDPWRRGVPGRAETLYLCHAGGDVRFDLGACLDSAPRHGQPDQTGDAFRSDRVNGTSLISIGRFSLLTDVPVSTLRFYDRIRLLRPLWIDPDTHYRFYGLEQLDVAIAIRVLRELDVPVEEIKALLDASPEEIHSVLEHHRRRTMESLAEMERTVQRLDRLLAHARSVFGPGIELVQETPQQVVSRRTAIPRATLEATIEELTATLCGTIGASGAPLGVEREIVLYHDILRRDGFLEIEVCMPVPQECDDAEAVWMLPGGAAARTVHLGPWDDIYLTYAKLFSWVLREGHDVKGPLREVYTTDDRDTPDTDQYVTELTWLLA